MGGVLRCHGGTFEGLQIPQEYAAFLLPAIHNFRLYLDVGPIEQPQGSVRSQSGTRPTPTERMQVEIDALKAELRQLQDIRLRLQEERDLVRGELNVVKQQLAEQKRGQARSIIENLGPTSLGVFGSCLISSASLKDWSPSLAYVGWTLILVAIISYGKMFFLYKDESKS